MLTLEKYGQDFIDKKQKMNDKSIKQLGYLSEKYSLQQIRSRVQHQRNKQAKEKVGNFLSEMITAEPTEVSKIKVNPLRTIC